MSVIAPLILSVVILLLVFDMLRRKKIREKYATLWLVVGLAMLMLAVFPRLLELIAQALSVQVPSNFLFAMSIVLALGVCLHLSWEISMVEDETRVLAEEAAILRVQLEKLEAKFEALNGRVLPSSTDDFQRDKE